MSAGRRSDGILPGGGIIALIGFVRERGGISHPDELVTSIRALHSFRLNRIRNSIDFLHVIQVLKSSKEEVVLNLNVTAEIERDIAAKVLSYLFTEYSAQAVGDALRYDVEQRTFWLDSIRLPGWSENIPYALLEFGIALRKSLHDRFWQVSAEYEATFLEAIRGYNHTGPSKHKIGIEALKEKLEAQAARGLEAEEWVVEYEHRRLNGHPTLDDIRRISDEDVSAGFDILSFSSKEVLVHDRFIEVKSFSREPVFYWSQQEVQRAAELREQYALYLVDRARMDDPAYHPTIIPGAFSYFFETERVEWRIANSEFRVSRIDPLTAFPDTGRSPG